MIKYDIDNVEYSINKVIEFYNINWWNNRELLYFAINYFVLWSTEWMSIFRDKLDKFVEREKEVEVYENFVEASKKYNIINPTIIHNKPHYNIESKQTNTVVEAPKRREFVIFIPMLCIFVYWFTMLLKALFNYIF